MNTQKTEAPNGNETIDYHSVWKTIQGEGPFSGMPATFVRLSGCNLQCPLCDTDYTSSRNVVTPVKLGSLIRSMTLHGGLVVLTGGEPFRQNIRPLVEDLLGHNFTVQIETNGTIHRDLPWDSEYLVVVCSPKTPKVCEELRPYISAWKYVLDANHVGADGLPTSALGMPHPPARPSPDSRYVYVQPIDVGNREENEVHLTATVESVMKHGYRLCLQTHKIIGLP